MLQTSTSFIDFTPRQPTWAESESGVQVVAINTQALSSGANTASHFVAHSSLMRDDLKPFIGSKGHPVAA